MDKAKIKKALKLNRHRDLEGHRQYCRLVGSMTPAECRELTKIMSREARRLKFENDRVQAVDVADFLARFYRPDRYHERGEEYAAALLASHQKHFDEYGYDIISRHESVTGKVVAYFKEEERQ